jgi:hypothetical protein
MIDTAAAFAWLKTMARIYCSIFQRLLPWQTAMACSLTMEDGSEFERQLNLLLKSVIRI